MPKLILRYPDGVAGAALLLLRQSCALIVFPSLSRVVPDESLSGIVSVVLTVALIAGMGARGAAFLLTLALAFELYGVRDQGSLFLASAAGSAGALALLGPGAYSIDAHRFGRRVIRVEPRSPERGDGS